MTRLMMLGPPGCGKGTQSQLLQKKRGGAHLSTGDMLRKEITQKTSLGKQVEKIMVSGGLVSDEIIIDMIAGRIEQDDCKEGFILDGFPRTVPQAKALDSLLARKNMALDRVIELQVDEEEMVFRICGRFSCAKCHAGYHDTLHPCRQKGICDYCGSKIFIRRTDDNEKTVRERLRTYRRQTEPIIAYYENKGLLRKVNGMLSIEEVTKELGLIIDGKDSS